MQDPTTYHTQRKLYRFPIGGTGTGRYQLKFPQDITLDEFGTLYVADRDNNRILIFNGKGSFQTEFGKHELVRINGVKTEVTVPGKKPLQFNLPRSIGVNSLGIIYVYDGMNLRVQMFNKEGEFYGFLGENVTKDKVNGKRPDYQVFHDSGCLRILPNDEVYVIEQKPDTTVLNIFNQAGRLISQTIHDFKTLDLYITSNKLYWLIKEPNIVIDNNTTINSSISIINITSLNGKLEHSIPISLFLKAKELAGEDITYGLMPHCLAVNSLGDIFIYNMGTGQIEVYRLINDTLNYLYSIGSRGDVNPELAHTEVKFKSISAIRIDKFDRLYITDRGTNYIQLLESDGTPVNE